MTRNGQSPYDHPSQTELNLLRSCEGYWVYSADGRVGIVEEVRPPGSRVPESLAVQMRPFGTRLLVIPIQEIVDISASDERVTVRSSPHVSESERLSEAGRTGATAAPRPAARSRHGFRMSVGFLHHACHDIGLGRPQEGHRIAELTEGYTDVFQLHVRYGIPASVHLSGRLLERIALHRPRFVERMVELAEEGLLSFVGGAYPEVEGTDTAPLDVGRFGEHLEVYGRELGLAPSRVTVCSVPGRVWDAQRLAPILTSPRLPNGGYAYVVAGGGRTRGHANEVAPDDVTEGPRVFRLEQGRSRIMTPGGSDLREWIPRRGTIHWRPVDGMLERQAGLTSASFTLYTSELERTAGVAGWGVALDHYEHFLRLHTEHPVEVAFLPLAEWLAEQDVGRAVTPQWDQNVATQAFASTSFRPPHRT